MRILAIGAHPDDIELCCAGSLAKYKSDGHTIGIMIMMDGATGSSVVPADELVAMRKLEAKASADIIGAKLYMLGFPDGKLERSVAECLKINEVMRDFQPDLIITHNDEDYISDHRIVSQLVIDTAIWSHVATMIPDMKPVDKTPSIVFMDSLSGINFIPERYIDISDHFETKRKMLSCHKSQQEWLGTYGGIDYVDMIETTAHYRGLQSGVQYAEGFRVWQGHQSTKCEPIMPY